MYLVQRPRVGYYRWYFTVNTIVANALKRRRHSCCLLCRHSRWSPRPPDLKRTIWLQSKQHDYLSVSLLIVAWGDIYIIFKTYSWSQFLSYRMKDVGRQIIIAWQMYKSYHTYRWYQRQHIEYIHIPWYSADTETKLNNNQYWYRICIPL